MNTKNKPKLGKLERIKDIRSVWGNEARDFSRWLAEEENLNDLGKILGLDLELIHTEERIGNSEPTFLRGIANPENLSSLRIN